MTKTRTPAAGAPASCAAPWAALCVLSLSAPNAALASPVSLELLGEPWSSFSTTVRVTPDGRTVIWDSYNYFEPSELYVSRDGMTTRLPAYEGYLGQGAIIRAVTDDGRMVFAAAGERQSLVAVEGVPYWLGHPSLSGSSVLDVSGDGRTIAHYDPDASGGPVVGLWREEYPGEGRVDYDHIVPRGAGDTYFDYWRMARNGHYSIGTVRDEATHTAYAPVFWIHDQYSGSNGYAFNLRKAYAGQHNAPEGTSFHNGIASDLSDDGGVVVGYSTELYDYTDLDEDENGTIIDGYVRPVVWRGAPHSEYGTELEFLSGRFIDDADLALVQAVSGDGNVFVGLSTFNDGLDVVHWVRYADGRTYSFDQILERAGIDLSEYTEGPHPYDIDEDGDTIVGTIGVGDGRLQTVVFRIPSPSACVVVLAGLGLCAGARRRA